MPHRLKRDRFGRFVKHRSNPTKKHKSRKGRKTGHRTALTAKRHHHVSVYAQSPKHWVRSSFSRSKRRGIMVNPSRKRHRRKAHKSRHYGRNPRVLGLQFPPFQTVLWSVGGFVATPFVEGVATRALSKVIPAGTGAGTARLISYGLKIGSVTLLTALTRRFVGVKQSASVLIGGTIYVGSQLIRDFMPQLVPQLAYYNPGQIGEYGQPLLGQFEEDEGSEEGSDMGMYSGMGSPMTENIPDRLNPASRF